MYEDDAKKFVAQVRKDLQQGQPAEYVDTILELAIGLDPKCAEAYFLRGSLYYMNNDCEAAAVNLVVAQKLLEGAGETDEVRNMKREVAYFLTAASDQIGRKELLAKKQICPGESPLPPEYN